MIVNVPLQWLFISVPKNATKTVYRTLARVGAVRWGHLFHRTVIPHELLHLTRITIKRNPYDRALSQYAYHHQGEVNWERARETNAFRDWLLLSFQKEEHYHPYMGTQMAAIIEPSRFQFIMRFEHLEEDLRKIPGCEGLRDIPHIGASHHPDWSEWMTEEERHLVRRFYREDFDYLGYE